jgi:ribosomal protein S18 acetylase RimI-like enzyme
MAVSAPFLVRRLQAEDAAAVRELAQGLDPWFNEEGLARMARDLDSLSGFVAVRGGGIVGFVLWARVDAEVADLSWMGVAQDVQRRGIGTALLDALVADLEPSGFRFLEVSTVADNVDYEPYVRTRRFYRARGFRDFRVDPLYWGTGEDRYDRLVLRRDLGAAAARTDADASRQNGAHPGGQSQAAFKPA